MTIKHKVKKLIKNRKKEIKDKRNRREALSFFMNETKKNGKSFFFTVIIPFYNTKKYLGEAIESVINQTVGIENIQIILVNDGSSDGSADIAKEYQHRFPKNIEYIEQENLGVSVARNKGIEAAKGLYINFLDSDDKWSETAFFDVVMFSFKYGMQDLLAAKIQYFDKVNNGHKRNYIFKKNRIINIESEYEKAILAAPQSFIKYSLIGETRFCEEMEYAEDARFMLEIMLDTESFASMKSPIYYYRKRFESDSLTDAANESLFYYNDLLTYYHEFMISKSKEKKKKVPRYIQAVLAYDIGFRIGKSSTTEDLDSDSLKSYKQRLVNIIREIEDDIIKNGKIFNTSNRIYMLSLKYDANYNELIQTLKVKDDEVVCNIKGREVAVDSISRKKNRRCRLDFVSVTENKEVVLEGTLGYATYPSEFVKVKIQYNDNECDADVYPRKHKGGSFPLDNISLFSLHFRSVIDLNEETRFRVLVSIAGSPFIEQKVVFGPFAMLHEKCPDSSYAIRKNNLFYLQEGNLCIKEIPDGFDREELEKKYRTDIKKKKNSENWISYRKMADDKDKSQKKLWLFFDRLSSAEDSAEEVFRYLSEHPIDNVDTAFVIREDAPDFKRLQSLGKVIPYGSNEHKWAALHADKYISASGEARYYFPFNSKDYKYINDLLTSDFIFVEHGIIKDDISGWLHRMNCNIKLFVATAERERQAILNDAYGYDENTVVLTGIPRFDKFDRVSNVEKEKVIYVMPTWRKWLASYVNADAGSSADVRVDKKGFTDSEYFSFYNDLLRSERLNDLLEKHDYQLFFALHPAMGPEANKFHSGGRVHVLKPESFSYGDAFKRMSLMITDYSSASFNEAYLRKPLIYAQFDFDDFYGEGKHIGNTGYFSFENDGFGPVEKNLNGVIDQIEKYLSNGCVMEDIYKQRADEFFFTPPEGVTRSELIVRRILELC